MGIQTGLSYFSNSIQGIPSVGVDVNVETVDATPRYPLGYMVERADGNIFRYSLIGTATNSGLLVGPSTTTAGATYGSAVAVASASAVAVQAEYPILPGQVGSHWLQVTIASIAINKYAGGYLITSSGTGGPGTTYRIVGNSATGTPTSTTLYIQLAEALQTAITATTGLIIVQSMYNDLAACTTSATTATGVLMATTTTTNLYAWVCTHGIAGCQEDNATNGPLAVGAVCVPSTGTAGAYMPIAQLSSTAFTTINTGLSQPIVGYCKQTSGGIGTSRQGVLFLTLE